MCTAATYRTKDFYFGRTLDYEPSFGEEIIITPRDFPLSFRKCGELPHHHAIIGLGCVMDGYPLYYDAVNERGLAIAGLNFVGSARYFPEKEGMDNIAQFELIPWLLGKCACVLEARMLLERINLVNLYCREDLPAAQLHWLISDRESSVTLECTASGMHIYENPVGVLTNNPGFEMQMFALNNYLNLSADSPEDFHVQDAVLKPYSRGMGAIGLPGDLSSQSRFVRAAFVKANSVSGGGEKQSVSQFFHILNCVDQQRGCCRLKDGQCEITICTSCCNTDRGVYYYTSYDNHQISAVDMHKENLDGRELIRYPLIQEEQIRMMN